MLEICGIWVTCSKTRTRNDAYIIKPVIATVENMAVRFEEMLFIKEKVAVRQHSLVYLEKKFP